MKAVPQPAAAWSPASWRRFPAEQQPVYREPAALERALAQLARLPPLVTSWEIESLKSQLAEAAAGRGFVLQGGDCAESFEDCESSAIASKLKILLQMSLVLVHGTHNRVVRIGRFGGQYAKPRSDEFETRGGQSLPAYRGAIVNRVGFSEGEREADPELLLRGYERAALTVNFIRSLVAGGFADLHHPEYWDLDFVRHSPFAADYQRAVESIGEALRFMETLAGRQVSEMNRVDFFTSHEGLHLPYEQAQTRQVPHRSGYYNLSAHMPWIGMRTAQVGGAHVEYFRGIANPIGLKVGPLTTPEQLVDLLEILDPAQEPGRIAVIHRFGERAIEEQLPRFVQAVQRAGRRPLWICDPMHGNTEMTPEGFKTRRFEAILGEVERSIEIHLALGGHLGGVHFELTGENVTECLGGARGLSAADLGRDYRSALDPRLNYEQSLELALLVARKLGPRKA